jgi:hypothetical protein
MTGDFPAYMQLNNSDATGPVSGPVIRIFHHVCRPIDGSSPIMLEYADETSPANRYEENSLRVWEFLVPFLWILVSG